MKIFLNKFFLIILFILNVSCESGNNIIDSPPAISSECNDGLSLGCDGICSSSPSENDVCGVCGGDGSSCEDLWNVFYDVDVPISGFQFNVDGATVTSASGGAAADVGFTISTGNNTILSFSFTGASIPAGSGILVQVEIDGDTNSACLTAPVISDANGESLDVEIINCNTIKSLE